MTKFLLLMLGLLAGLAHSADLTVKVRIPRIAVAEYHRPFVVIWIEKAEEQRVLRNLAVWYQIDPEKDDGTQWLKDLRQWWRRGGKEAATPIAAYTGATRTGSSPSSLRVAPAMPIDAVTGATRPVGEHRLIFKAGAAPLGTLAPGKYNLTLEAARENGGRELLRIPFEWPATLKVQSTVEGKTELGRVTLEVNP
ncbi:DUF2271 domain-containing protein [Steroidobacter cummioxidans]|uniref:DUF2271 domain-containing protein n=1 Tax=Steroidobacter cummioxidans TaxID=1803913 RepID=UPI000E31E928|nr:DUF2271 domain-containing protein [Steroidobacter cummioxidans]